MSIDYFKARYGYEMEGMWMPRVTAITALVSRPFFGGGYAAADWGTKVHEAIENTLKGNGALTEERTAPSLRAFEKWQKAQRVKIANPETEVEAKVADFENGYAGTVDMVAQVGGTRGIVDVKTANAMHEEYSLQTAAYLAAYNKGVQKKLRAKARWILRIDQYEECRGCFARKKEKSRNRILGGEEACNHQWSLPVGEAEFLELEGQEEDLQAFLAAKEVWEWYHRAFLRKVRNYQKNITQKILI